MAIAADGALSIAVAIDGAHGVGIIRAGLHGGIDVGVRRRGGQDSLHCGKPHNDRRKLWLSVEAVQVSVIRLGLSVACAGQIRRDCRRGSIENQVCRSRRAAVVARLPIDQIVAVIGRVDADQSRAVAVGSVGQTPTPLLLYFTWSIS